MGFEVFLKGIVIGLLASIPLGPIGVMCIQRTLSKSQRSGFVSGLGAASADTLFATVALFSLTVVLSFIEDNMVIIKVLGGISVIIVGMTILLKNPVGQIRPQPGRQRQQPVERLPVGVADYAGQSGLYPDLRRAVRGARRQPRRNPVRQRPADDPRRAVRHFAVVVLADVLHQLSASQIPAPPPAVDEPDIGKRHRDARSRSHFIHLHSHESTCP